MIKRTLYFGNPSYLRLRQQQMVIEFSKSDDKPERSIPIEDVGLVILDHQQITISQGLLTALVENNAAVLNCDQRHLPSSMLLPMRVNHVYTEKLRHQLNSSEPLRKNLWQQTVKTKIQNQAQVLLNNQIPNENMRYWAGKVRSGDPDNYEGRAAANYWEKLMAGFDSFRRGRYGEPPNNLLNYGYAVLRALVARSLVASGMLPALGIHHRNKYNPFCLADDIMEPYRPFVDELVLGIIDKYGVEEVEELTPEIKKELLVLPTIDVRIDGESSPLMVGMQRTTASLMQCFEGEKRRISYPVIETKNGLG